MHPSVQGPSVQELFGDDVDTVYVSPTGDRRALDVANGVACTAIPPIHLEPR